VPKVPKMPKMPKVEEQRQKNKTPNNTGQEQRFVDP
jgi:hypothetical protein